MAISKTEMRNPLSMHMDKMSTEEMARLVICANYEAVKAAEDALPAISRAIDVVAAALASGGHLVYVGAGTSGRLGVIDATECPPTFGVPAETVSGIIAGGNERMFSASENEEDKYENGKRDILAHGISSKDVVCGVSAAGNAQYVMGAVETAKAVGALTLGISSNENSLLMNTADIPIFTDTGAEILTGSTRLKAATAQKIVMNTLTTCAMTKLGNVYENMMINLNPSNEKLRGRVIRIVKEILSCSDEEATERLTANDWNIRKAIENNI